METTNIKKGNTGKKVENANGKPETTVINTTDVQAVNGDLKPQDDDFNKPVFVEPQPYVSDELTRLDGEKAVIIEKFKAPGIEIGSDEHYELSVQLIKVNGQIKAEKSRIDNERRAQEIEDKRNARKRIFDDAIEAYEAMIAAEADYKAGTGTIEQSNAANLEYKNKRDAVYNELTARYATSTPAKPKNENGSSNGNPRTGTLKQQIIELYLKHTGAGMTKSQAEAEIRAAGFNDGTANNAVNEYLRSIGEIK